MGYIKGALGMNEFTHTIVSWYVQCDMIDDMRVFFLTGSGLILVSNLNKK